MRHPFTALLALVVGLLGTQALAGDLKRDSFASVQLRRDMPYWVYLPDGYDATKWRYPVLYLLHGAGGDESAWIEHGLIKEKADRLIARGDIPPTLIVMPGCRGCWWIDGAKDKAESAFWKDLVPTITRRYRTIESRRGRVIAGLSAGGYGTIRFALKYPGRVAAVAALGPAIYQVSPPADSSARIQPPFQDSKGAFSETSWRANNYPNLIERYFSQSARVPFYLVSGDNDRFGIAFETMEFYKRLYARQPELSELRIVDGDHSWDVWSSSIDNAMRYLFRHAAAPTVDESPNWDSGSRVIARHP